MTAKYTLNFTDFDKKFMKIVKEAIPEDTAEGVRQALQELKIDAQEIPPRTPHLEGGLRASGKVKEVKTLKKSISGEIMFGGKGTSEKGIAFNVPYAHRWHEAEPGTINWSEPGVGPKYLSSKMIMFKQKYMKIIAEVIRRRAK